MSTASFRLQYSWHVPYLGSTHIAAALSVTQASKSSFTSNLTTSFSIPQSILSFTKMGLDIYYWICHARFRLCNDRTLPKKKSSTSAYEDVMPQELVSAQEGSCNSIDTYISDTSSESANLPNGLENDALIPRPTQIIETFSTSYSRWCACVVSATDLPMSWEWIQRFDLCAILLHVPALPQDLKGLDIIKGSSMWRVYHHESSNSSVDEYDNSNISSDEYLDENSGSAVDEFDGHWDPTLMYSSSKQFYLTAGITLIFDILSVESQQEYENQCLPESSDALLILTLCWSYILFAQITESQGRILRYSSAALAQVTNSSQGLGTSSIVLDLGNASANLTQWLSALLVPKRPYLASGKRPISPWAAEVSDDLSILIVSSRLEQAQVAALTCQEAIRLLKEFCSFHDFGSQPIVALCAALVFPFNQYYSLRPRLPLLRLFTSSPNSIGAQCKERYADELPYFMTLSLREESLGSALWSSFWEPGVDCTDVSACMVWRNFDIDSTVHHRKKS